MNDPVYGPERSLAFYVAAEQEQRVPPTEATLTAWAVLALLLVLAAIVLGGCS